MHAPPPRRTVAAVAAEELADVLRWQPESEAALERLATMSDAELTAHLHEQAAGYPAEVLELLHRFELLRASLPQA